MLSYEKAAQKMLVKLTPGVNFTNIIIAHFCQYSFRQKKLKPKQPYKKAAQNTFVQKKLFEKCW